MPVAAILVELEFCERSMLCLLTFGGSSLVHSNKSFSSIQYFPMIECLLNQYQYTYLTNYIEIQIILPYQV